MTVRYPKDYLYFFFLVFAVCSSLVPFLFYHQEKGVTYQMSTHYQSHGALVTVPSLKVDVVQVTSFH